MADQIFEASVGIGDDQWMMMNTYNLLNIQRCRNTNVAWQYLSTVISFNFVNVSSPVLLNVETSPLIYTVNYCTGFYIISTLD